MEIKILFNSAAISEGYAVGWGVSFLIDNKILFDTGEKGIFLLNNIKKMKVDISLIEAVVISHDHWDHAGGLWELLKQRPNINVYSCPGFSDDFKQKVKACNGKLIENNNFKEIDKNIFVTGEISGEYKGKNMPEQALVLDTDKGLLVLTGCAHPGIIEILKVVKEKFPEKQFYSVFGGFHLMNNQSRDVEAIVNTFREFGVKKVGPTHCSGAQAEDVFKIEYGDDYFDVKVGQVII